MDRQQSYSTQEENSLTNDLEIFGWSTKGWYWNKYKIWGVGLVLITLFICILVLIIRIYRSHLCIDRKYELMAFIITEIIIGVFFIVGIKKHMPFGRNSKRGKFNGTEIMKRLQDEQYRLIREELINEELASPDREMYTREEYNRLVQIIAKLKEQLNTCRE